MFLPLVFSREAFMCRAEHPQMKSSMVGSRAKRSRYVASTPVQ